jgi:integrase
LARKPPLKHREIWAIRVRLQLAQRSRDLALFNLGIDSKLRGCDLIGLKVQDVAPCGHASARAIVMQRKTQRPVQFELTSHTRDAVTGWIAAARLRPGHFLFPSRITASPHITTRQYARIVRHWVASIGLDPPLWYALNTADQGDPDLPPDAEYQSRSITAWPYEAGEHRPLPGN